MFRWIARAFLFRFLPRRLLPVLTVIDLVAIARALRKRQPSAPDPPQRHAVNEPYRSRTEPPPPLSDVDTNR
jgi:hypothetical protein